MRRPQQVLRHARAALHQAAASIALFRAQLDLGQASSTPACRATGLASLRTLERVHGLLSEQYLALVMGPQQDMAEHCRSFFSSYDAFLDEIRRARLELTREMVSTQAAGTARGAR